MQYHINPIYLTDQDGTVSTTGGLASQARKKEEKTRWRQICPFLGQGVALDIVPQKKTTPPVIYQQRFNDFKSYLLLTQSETCTTSFPWYLDQHTSWITSSRQQSQHLQERKCSRAHLTATLTKDWSFSCQRVYDMSHGWT